MMHPDNGPYLIINLRGPYIYRSESNYYDAVLSAICYAKKNPGATVVAVDANKNIVYRTIY